MRDLSFIIALVLSSCASALGDDYPKMTRFNGKSYYDLKVNTISADGVTFKHTYGEFTIPLEKLPMPIALRFKEQVRAALDEKARRLDLKEKEAKYPGYKALKITVVQVLSDGILCDRMELFSTPVVTSGLGASGGGGGSYGGEVYSKRSGNIIFIAGSFNGAFDGEERSVGAYPDGVYPYIAVSGAQRTVQKWIAVP
jgi:hypothetical protein